MDTGTQPQRRIDFFLTDTIRLRYYGTDKRGITRGVSSGLEPDWKGAKSHGNAITAGRTQQFSIRILKDDNNFKRKSRLCNNTFAMSATFRYTVSMDI